MINRLRRGLSIPVGSGETAGFGVKESNKRIGFNLGHVDGSRLRYVRASDVQVKTAAFEVQPQDDGRTFLLQLLAGFAVTLPASDEQTRGMEVTFYNDLLPTSGNGYQIAPASGDFITSTGLGRTVDTVLRNPVGTDVLGDFVTLQADGAGGWRAKAIGGTWTKV